MFSDDVRMMASSSPWCEVKRFRLTGAYKQQPFTSQKYFAGEPAQWLALKVFYSIEM
jgi:hypothetical protein